MTADDTATGATTTPGGDDLNAEIGRLLGWTDLQTPEHGRWTQGTTPDKMERGAYVPRYDTDPAAALSLLEYGLYNNRTLQCHITITPAGAFGCHVVRDHKDIGGCYHGAMPTAIASAWRDALAALAAEKEGQAGK